MPCRRGADRGRGNNSKTISPCTARARPARLSGATLGRRVRGGPCVDLAGQNESGWGPAGRGAELAGAACGKARVRGAEGGLRGPDSS
jgi:hypothetical protein